ncbi:sodium/proline symporter PutP [Lipingzhangella sp. LS1_29]|uniref:Sodium/proline symporter n=1 Tax=Lipingzhangella rawalii TaxID=2055835 RepID=A0ABU2HBH6_9ACTN|nr:sodium/proline symporter PutP [Lipingzhangella rawalii]MDS1272342.1 sodium/proline symporter PutP [Lipingzhangella rawalii]
MNSSVMASVTTFAVYLLLMVVIGVWVFRRTVNLSDYVLGGRQLNSWVAGLSANASDFSAWLLLGLPGAIYLSGLGEAWIAVGLAVGFAASWYLLAGRLRVFTERATDARSGGESNSLTLSSYLENRFDDRGGTLRAVSAVLILVFYLFYVASGLVAAGGLFEQVFGVSGNVAILTGVTVVVVYTFFGGFLAVSFTDVIQAAMMWCALLVVPVVAIVAVSGDPDRGAGGDLGSLLGGVSGLDGSWAPADALVPVVVISGLAWGLGYFGQPHILARFMGIRSPGDVRAAGVVSVGWAVSAMALALVVALAGVAYFDPPLDEQTAEYVFPQLIQALMNPWVAGLLLAAILAAVMSTADSQLLVASAALTEDGYRTFVNREASPRALVWISRAAVVLVAAVAAGIALSGNNTIMELVGYAWAGFGAGFGPVILLSLYWRRMNRVGALAGMITGGFVAVAWDLLDERVLDTGLYAMVPAVALSFLAILVANRLGRASQQMEQDFDRVDAEYRGLNAVG